MKKSTSPSWPFPHPLAALVALAIATAAAMPAAVAAPFAVDPALPAYQPHAVTAPSDARYSLPDGSIRIIGAEHAQVIVDGFNALFGKTHPGFKFTTQLKGTTTAMPALTHGVTLFGPMGREVNHIELVPYQKIVGQEPLELCVAHDSNTSHTAATNLAIYVNKANPVERLTVEQVAQIFATGHAKGDIANWNQVGLKDEWAKRAIHVYATPEYTGFGDYMQRHQLGGLQSAPNTERYNDSTDILKHVSEDPAAIGIAAIGRATAQTKIVALAGKEGGEYSAGSVEDVIGGKYPYGRFLTFAVRRVPGQPLDPLVKEYMRLVYSMEGQKIIAAEEGAYIPLTAQEAAAQLARLD